MKDSGEVMKTVQEGWDVLTHSTPRKLRHHAHQYFVDEEGLSPQEANARTQELDKILRQSEIDQALTKLQDVAEDLREPLQALAAQVQHEEKQKAQNQSSFFDL